MPLIEYKCKSCQHYVEQIMSHPIPSEIKCKNCGNMMEKQLSFFGGYKWGAGDNSASVVPKKYRGEK